MIQGPKLSDTKNQVATSKKGSETCASDRPRVVKGAWRWVPVGGHREKPAKASVDVVCKSPREKHGIPALRRAIHPTQSYLSDPRRIP